MCCHQRVACCSAAYIVALLHDGFKLGMHERRLRFTNYVEDPQGRSTDIDWTLGRVSLSEGSMHLNRGPIEALDLHFASRHSHPCLQRPACHFWERS